MTLVDIADIYYPRLVGVAASTAYSIMTINASGEKAAFVMRARVGGVVDEIGILTDTVANSQTIRVSLQAVITTTGDPDEASGHPFYRDIASPASDTYYTVLPTDDGTDTGAKKTLARGELFAIVIEFESTVGDVDIARNIDDRNDWNFPYSNLKTAAWAPQEAGFIGHVHYTTPAYETMIRAESSDARPTYVLNSGTTPDERGNIFTLPFDCRIVGFWGYFDIDNDCDVVLYDNSSVAQSTQALTNDVQVNPTNARPFVHYFDDATAYVKDVAWRLVLKPGASSSTMFTFQSPTTALMAANEGGANIHMTTRTDAGAWTETTDERCYMGLIIDQVHDDDAGGGGGSGVATIVNGGLAR